MEIDNIYKEGKTLTLTKLLLIITFKQMQLPDTDSEVAYVTIGALMIHSCDYVLLFCVITVTKTAVAMLNC